VFHDPKLLELLSGFPTEKFSGESFRATPIGLDPLAPSTRGGRWAPQDEAAVLYTSLAREGALAEIAFYWSQLTPLPSKPVSLHRLRVTTRKTLRLIRADLENLGVTPADYEVVSCPRTQAIGAAAAFLGRDGLVAPSARWQCDHLMIFTDSHDLDDELAVVATEEIDWLGWARENHFMPGGV
jgi:RES domain